MAVKVNQRSQNHQFGLDVRVGGGGPSLTQAEIGAPKDAEIGAPKDVEIGAPKDGPGRVPVHLHMCICIIRPPRRT